MKKTFAVLSFITIASFGCGGGGKKTPASAKSMPSSTMDCEKFADKGIELTVAADPTTADKAKEGRGQLVTMCQDGVAKKELDQPKYDCALGAATIQDFMTCIGAN